MVGGGHDDQRCEHRVRQREPPPPGAAGHDDPERDHDRPAHVQRRHGGVLVGQAVLAGWPVHGGAVDGGGVHEAEPAQHPRRGDRDHQVHHQAGRGQQRQAAPHPEVVRRLAQEHPDQEGRGGREVDGRVVDVRGAGEQVAVEHQRLQGQLVGQPEDPLQVPDHVRVVEGLADVLGRDHPAQLVRAEHQRDDEQLPPGPSPDRPRSARGCGRRVTAGGPGGPAAAFTPLTDHHRSTFSMTRCTGNVAHATDF
ncbi:MAG: hypothetical protein AVDCRST_MAG41-2989 [uncultured Corynebacteriales bacterium]|uniref:Uncharacterized protein n=1 Tax=uncultured Mycobacteriales bacterium TaxID=581187 RepID=A0A6J4J6B7_9ACTN|nr:MAG: hypothetical protein AVDCRST_MAG41-2989 [uncultured Corynebacteriales bacterium]